MEKRKLEAGPSWMMGKDGHTAELTGLSKDEKQQWLERLGERLSERLRLYYFQWDRITGKSGKGK